MATLEQKYQKKTDKEHILDNPDTYIGSVENINQSLYVYEETKIQEKIIEKNPGQLKQFHV